MNKLKIILISIGTILSIIGLIQTDWVFSLLVAFEMSIFLVVGELLIYIGLFLKTNLKSKTKKQIKSEGIATIICGITSMAFFVYPVIHDTLFGYYFMYSHYDGGFDDLGDILILNSLIHGIEFLFGILLVFKGIRLLKKLQKEKIVET